jgi:LDH2 family malate/lactate/ureidoglycolate dehydrogenase
MLLARAGTNIAIEKARDTGIGMAALRVPLVVAGAHVQQIIDAGQVAITMTQSFPMVAPFGGRVPELGNAPVAFGLPAGRNDPVIIDMSLTQTSSSGVKAAAQQGLSVPTGFLLDEFGEPTTDPAAYPAVGHGWHDRQRSRGSLTPLGDSHKGYALIFVVGLLTAVLTDTSFPWEATEVSMGSPRGPGERYGSLILAIDPGELLGTEISSRVDAYIDHLRESPTRDGVAEILFPGEKSQRLRRARRGADVFAVPRSHYEAFVELAREFSISL